MRQINDLWEPLQRLAPLFNISTKADFLVTSVKIPIEASRFCSSSRLESNVWIQPSMAHVNASKCCRHPCWTPARLQMSLIHKPRYYCELISVRHLIFLCLVDTEKLPGRGQYLSSEGSKVRSNDRDLGWSSQRVDKSIGIYIFSLSPLWSSLCTH